MSNNNEKALREFKPPPRMFTFHSWRSVGIAIVNKASVKNTWIRFMIRIKEPGFSQILQKYQNPLITFLVI